MGRSSRLYRRVGLAAAAALVVLAAGCGGGRGALLCYVGGTMRPAIEELAAAFEKQTGTHVDIQYKDSGALLLMIEQTGEGDLYVCHDPFAAKLERKNLHRRIWTVAALAPAIAVPKGNPKNIKGLRDLARDDVRLGVTHETYSTLGHINPIMFRRAGIVEAIAKSIARGTITRSGGAVANAVMVGELDACLCWNAVIAARKDKLDLVPIEAEYRPDPKLDAVTSASFGHVDVSCIKVTIATLACSTQPEAAATFAEFVASPEGLAVFAKRGFSPSPEPPAGTQGKAAAAEPIELYCAASLRLPAAESIETFRQETGIDVTVDYGGSGTLLSRLRANKTADLYLPGDVRYVDEAARYDLVLSKHSVCYFVPVILVRKGNPKGIKALADLARPGLQVGMGDPEACAIGKVSMQLFGKNNVPFDQVRQNLVYSSSTVNLLGVQVDTGHLDATIVWDAIAAQYPGTAQPVAIPPSQNVISHVGIGILKHSRQQDRAKRFVDFLAGDRGQAILRKHNFTTTLPTN